MSDDKATIKELKNLISEFRDERDWKQFHNPKDVAIDLAVETGELLDHFRFKSNAEIEEYLKDEKNKREVSHEIADCLHAIILIALECEIDMDNVFKEKLELLRKKYPIEKAKGVNKKYTQL